MTQEIVIKITLSSGGAEVSVNPGDGPALPATAPDIDIAPPVAFNVDEASGGRDIDIPPVPEIVGEETSTDEGEIPPAPNGIGAPDDAVGLEYPPPPDPD